MTQPPTPPTLPTLPALRSRDWMAWASGLHGVAGYLLTGAANLQSSVAGLLTSVGSLQTSVTALAPGAWQAMPLTIAATAFVTGHDAMYRVESSSRVWGRGWAQVGASGMSGSASLLSAPLPVAYRPAQAREAWPIGAGTPARPYRVIINPDGTMVAADSALAAGAFLNFDRATWPLG